MEDIQNKIRKFCEDRKWDNFDVKDLLLNISDEVGEIWGMIKWVDEDTQKQLFEKNKDEVEDFIGDMIFIILKIANHGKINSEKAILKTLQEYEERFPVKETKGHHANLFAGGVDKKYTGGK